MTIAVGPGVGVSVVAAAILVVGYLLGFDVANSQLRKGLALPEERAIVELARECRCTCGPQQSSFVGP